jgi:hypothetical protein
LLKRIEDGFGEGVGEKKQTLDLKRLAHEDYYGY